MEESELIQLVLDGDTATWEPLVLAHQQAVFRLAYLFLGDPDEAEDVAQETFLRAWKHLNQFDTTRSLRPWLLSIASNLASNRRRSAGRYVAALVRAFRNETRESNIENRSEQHHEANDLWRAVQQLGTTDQQIIYLRFYLELSVAETAETLAIAEGTVKSRLYRATEKLRNIIKQDFPVLLEGHKL